MTNTFPMGQKMPSTAYVDECDAPRAAGVHTNYECLNKRVEENSILIERLRERLGCVSLPTGPRNSNGVSPEKANLISPMAQALNGLEMRLADINRGLEYLLSDLDI